MGSRGPVGAHVARPRPLCSRFHGPSVLPWKQGPGSPCGGWEATGALLGLGRVPAEGVEVGSPENLLPLLLGSQLPPLLWGLLLPPGALGAEDGAWGLTWLWLERDSLSLCFPK